MKTTAKVLEFLGMIITGIGLFYGIFQNDMGQEFAFMGAGIIVFMIGMVLERWA